MRQPAIGHLRFLRRVVPLACLLVPALLICGMPPAAAENLPVSVSRYAKACFKTTGELTKHLNNSGTGVIYCLWASGGDGTECKVGSNQVNVCTIRCRSDACLAANPDKHNPLWPLNGGPGKKIMAPGGTLAPDTMAPAN